MENGHSDIADIWNQTFEAVLNVLSTTCRSTKLRYIDPVYQTRVTTTAVP